MDSANRRRAVGRGTAFLLAALAAAAALSGAACIVRLSSGPETAGGRTLNPTAFVNAVENVSVVVGTDLARHSPSEEVFGLQILVRNDSSENIHVEARNFLLRDPLGNEHPPIPPEGLKGVYGRVNFDYELAATTEFVSLLNAGLGSFGNLASNFYPHGSERLVIDRLDMPSSSRIVDILYYDLPGWRDIQTSLTLVVKNLRDRPPLEVTFTITGR